jgi:hypothetical protein
MRHEATKGCRSPRKTRLTADLVVVGGGLAGTCCAITAARAGIRVILIHDRPVLGGNASSEVRLWILGATAHMGTNNRWAREGGVIDEILVENTYRNPEGNPLFVDTLLLEKVVEEPNITLLLNTAVFDVAKSHADTVASLTAFCSQNSVLYEAEAPLFCDASGDGIVGFLAGAAFRMGVESRHEFGEQLAPEEPCHELLGHSIYFYSKDVGRPVRFVPPSYALKDITRIPRYRQFDTRDHGCRLWWIEWGGRLDTVHETEAIKWELWKVVYGVWDYIKNSGRFPEAETLTLEWVGQIPGKRESRRFEGDYLLTQRDIVEQRAHPDAVSFGGWAIDLHPADGVFSAQPGCDQWHPSGVYAIPYRCLYSRNITNLFLAGRIISTSHVAFGSTRVMATCAHGGQAVGMAAALCRRRALRPRDLASGSTIAELQTELLRTGQYIAGLALADPDDLGRQATVSASSRLRLAELPPDGPSLPLADAWAMLLPVAAGAMPRVTCRLDVARPTRLRAELRVSSRPDNHTPDVTLSALDLELTAGDEQAVALEFDATIDAPRYAFVCLMPNPHISVRCSERRLTGVLALVHRAHASVARSARQDPPADTGIDSFEFWHPARRPAGHNFALIFSPPIDVFGPQNVINGVARPTVQPNAWVTDPGDASPTLTFRWDRPRRIARIELVFDTDFDHPMESVLMGHPERVMPFCVRSVRVRDAHGREVAALQDNHQTRRTIRLQPPLETQELSLDLDSPESGCPAALFEVRLYSPDRVD